MKFIFLKTDTLNAQLIRAFEGGDYNHVAIQIDDTNVIEAQAGKGVRVRSVHDVLAAFPIHLIVEVACDPAKEKDGVDFLKRQLGKEYDWSAIIGFAFWRDWQEEDKWMCSELAAAFASYCGFALSSKRHRVGVRLFLEIAYAWAEGQAAAKQMKA